MQGRACRYERLEVELSAHYSMYVQAWRNMSYLESELDEINAAEEDRVAENDRQLKMMQRRLREACIPNRTGALA